MTDDPERVERRGRRSKREDWSLFLAQLRALGFDIPADVIDKLDLGPAPKVEPESVSIRQTAERVLAELNRRLADPLEAAKLPGTRLIDLADKLRVTLESEPAEPGSGGEEPTIAEIIAGIEGLPAGRKREILEGERRLLVAEVAAIDAQLAQA